MQLFFRRPARRRRMLRAAGLWMLPALGLAAASWFGARALRRG
jgi:hypothetical protein